MTILSKPLTWGVLATGAIGWAVWYDRKRTSHPDYKKNLVEKRRAELVEKRKKEDPFYFVDSLPLIADHDMNNPMAVQTFTMQNIQKGEVLLEQKEVIEGCSYIALGLSYMPQQQYQQTLMQLQQGLPREYVVKISQLGNKSRARVMQQRMSFMAKKETKNAGGDIKEVEAKPPAVKEAVGIDDGPEDVDSIDGDTEEKIVELDSSEDEEEELEKDEVVKEEEDIPAKVEEVEEEQAVAPESEEERAVTPESEEEQAVTPESDEEEEVEPEAMRESSEPEIVKQEEIDQVKEEMEQQNKSENDSDTDAENEQLQSSENGDVEDDLD